MLPVGKPPINDLGAIGGFGIIQGAAGFLDKSPQQMPGYPGSLHRFAAVAGDSERIASAFDKGRFVNPDCRVAHSSLLTIRIFAFLGTDRLPQLATRQGNSLDITGAIVA